MLHYAITAVPERHQWHISLTYRREEKSSLHLLQMANWTPGSYMVRDFSRHVMQVQAACNGQPAAVQSIDKNTWRLPDSAGEWKIDYIVYANDLSCRASLLDNERGFFDGACLFLTDPDRRHEACEITLHLPDAWHIQTTLPQQSPRVFTAQNYAELIDHPFEMGAQIEVLHFEAHGIPHRIALSGHYPDFDRERLIADVKTICAYEIALFKQPAPFSEYLFLLHLGDKIYGGLEHISSTALHADRWALPAHDAGREPDAAYTELLGLIAHEYFHAWNVKSIKPTKFQPYDLNKETYTEQLWAYEGITSYYDDLILVRSGVIGIENYLTLLAKNLTRVQRTGGRQYQTLAQSSFAAWHKYYKQDENSPNAIVSYYQQGAIAALCLDLHIRRQSPHSLDSIMQQLYARYRATGKGTDEGQWQQLAQEFTQLDLHDFFQRALYSTEDLPTAECLKQAGLALHWLPAPASETGSCGTEAPPMVQAACDVGGRFTQQADGALITHVFNGGALERAGLKPKDKIIAVNGFACRDTAAQLLTRIDDEHQVHYFRDGMLHTACVQVQAALPQTAYLHIVSPDLLAAWLYG